MADTPIPHEYNQEQVDAFLRGIAETEARLQAGFKEITDERTATEALVTEIEATFDYMSPSYGKDRMQRVVAGYQERHK